MEIILFVWLMAAFTLGVTIGSGLFCTGLLIGRIQSSGGVREYFRKEKVLAEEDIPGTDAYFEKARRSPEDGGHADPFEEELIELNRHQ
jgi:hypothetical protein